MHATFQQLAACINSFASLLSTLYKQAPTPTAMPFTNSTLLTHQKKI
jgi:hypothetical protein